MLSSQLKSRHAQARAQYIHLLKKAPVVYIVEIMVAGLGRGF